MQTHVRTTRVRIECGLIIAELPFVISSYEMVAAARHSDQTRCFCIYQPTQFKWVECCTCDLISAESAEQVKAFSLLCRLVASPRQSQYMKLLNYSFFDIRILFRLRLY